MFRIVIPNSLLELGRGLKLNAQSHRHRECGILVVSVRSRQPNRHRLVMPRHEIAKTPELDGAVLRECVADRIDEFVDGGLGEFVVRSLLPGLAHNRFTPRDPRGKPVAKFNRHLPDYRAPSNLVALRFLCPFHEGTFSRGSLPVPQCKASGVSYTNRMEKATRK